MFCSLVVAASFTLFAVEELNTASHQSRVGVRSTPETAGAASVRAPALDGEATSGARRALDDANDALLAPFAGLTDFDSAWATRGLPAVLGLLLYGFGLGYLARFARGHG